MERMLKTVKSFQSITQLFPSVPEQQGTAFYLTASHILGELSYSLPLKIPAQVLPGAAARLVGSSRGGLALLCAPGWSAGNSPALRGFPIPLTGKKIQVALGNHLSILTDLSYSPVKPLRPLLFGGLLARRIQQQSQSLKWGLLGFTLRNFLG